MELFSQEIVNITRIRTVKRYEITEKVPTDGAVRHFPADLKTYELIFYFSGSSDTHFCGVELHDEPGALRYLPKGKHTGQYFVKRGSPGACIDIYFDTADPMPDKALCLRNMEFLASRFEKIYTIWSEKKTGYYVNSMAVLYEIIQSIHGHRARYLTGAQKDRLEPAYAYILEHYREPDFDYSALCKAAGLSNSYFSKSFAARYHTSPVKLVTNLRVEYAKELLVTGRCSVTEIAERCGFQNVYYFSNVFKRITGVSPKNYEPK